MNEWDKDGYSALHIAATHNHPKAASVLLCAGADPFRKPQKTDMCYDYGLEPSGTPLSKACSYGHVAIVAEVLPYIKTQAAITKALFVAAKYKQSAVVALLLTHPMADANRRLKSQTLLYVACSHRNAKIIQLLLDAGADPNTAIASQTDTWNSRKAPEGLCYTAIHALASGSSVHHGSSSRYFSSSISDQPAEETITAIESMIQAGANLYQVDPCGHNALAHACDGVTTRILLDAGVDPYLVNTDGGNLLHGHVKLDVLRQLLERTRIDTSLRLPYEETTPLLKSLKDGHVEKALLLLEYGADCMGCDKDGSSAFHLAVSLNYRDRNKGLLGPLLAALRAAGADVNLRDKSGCTPLHKLDFRSFNDELFNLLLEAGLDTETKNNEGETALFVALKHCSDWYRPKICDKLVAAGCNLNAVDKEGRNLLHTLKSSDAKVVQYLVDKGLDPKQTDLEGNTLWHVAAGHRSSTEIFQKLQELDLDPEQSNLSGRTPLHMVSSTRPHALDERGFKNTSPITISQTTHFDDFLKYITKIDPADSEGVTPLHLASTFSEYLTKRLLTFGADPFRCTSEGLTIIHLAARSRQPNILGVLFECCTTSEESDALAVALNAVDKSGRTAMYYACASGCVASVKMLIEAGAKVESDHYEGSAWQGCVDFDEENMKWKYPYRADGRDYDWSAKSAGGVTIENNTRPDMREAHHDSTGFKHRIDEIAELLSYYLQFAGNSLITALEDAVNRESDYIVECLAALRSKMNIAIPQDLLEKVDLCLQRRHQSVTSSSRFYACWQNRKFDIATEALIQDGLMTSASFVHSRIHQLVHDGFVSILERILTPVMAQQFDDMDWVFEQEQGSRRGGGRYVSLNPLLITACQRDIPNMDMIRFLVEKMEVNVNAQKRTNENTYDGSIKQIFHGSALHYLVWGMNWWQTRQALPYLLSKGALLDLKDNDGFTPLRASLDKVKTILFDRFTVETLVVAGADVNVIDTHYRTKGLTCLSRSAEDPGMAKYLLEHGAIVTHSDIRNAILKARCKILELLLSHGGDPNARDALGAQFQDRSQDDDEKPKIRREEAKYPLHYLASISTPVGVGEEMASILLRHGANLKARYEDTTLMHCVMHNSRIARPLLSHPHLENIEATDAEGCTLLLAASKEQSSDQNSDTAKNAGTSLVRLLLDRGANIRARDGEGRNLLHHMLSDTKHIGGWSYHPPRAPRNADVGYVSTLAPALVHEQDVNGDTPLHYTAMNYIKFVSDLLDAGANPCTENNAGYTALHYLMRGEWVATEEGEIVGLRRDIFDRLLARGADLNARNHRAETPIFCFFREDGRHRSTVAPTEKASRERREAYSLSRLILETPLYEFFERMGVRWTDVNSDDQNLLHHVAGTDRNSSKEVALYRFKYLMTKGLDVAAEDNRRRTPLDIAAAFGHTEILALFKKEVAGADLRTESQGPMRGGVGQVFDDDLFD